MTLHKRLKLVPEKVVLPEGKSIGLRDENKYTFSRNCFLIEKDNQTFITKELLTMVQLLPALKVSGLEEDRTLTLIDRKDATHLLSEIKKIEEAEVQRKKKAADARKKKAEANKAKEKEVQENLPVEEEILEDNSTEKEKA